MCHRKKYFEQKQWSQANNDFIAVSPKPVNCLAYSAGSLSLPELSQAAIANLEYLTMINSFVGKEALNEKFKRLRPLLPLPSMETMKNNLAPICFELAKQKKLRIIISKNDEYFNPQQVVNFFTSIPGLPEPIIRDGGHAITTQELHQLFTHQHTAIPPHN